jgi:hypothetical protein
MATAARNNPELPVVCGHWMSDEQTFHNPLRLREGLPTDRELAHLLDAGGFISTDPPAVKTNFLFVR